MQRITLIAGFDALTRNDTCAKQGETGAEEAPPRSFDRVERIVLPNPNEQARPCLRYSSWVGSASDLLEGNAPTRPTTASADPRLDMQTVVEFQRAVESESTSIWGARTPGERLQSRPTDGLQASR